MSKAPKNIEKILLGVAVVAAGGLGALGVMKQGAVAEDFPDAPPGRSGKETAVAGAEEISATVNSLKLDRVWLPAEVDAPKAEGGKRTVNLMVGVPLFAQRENQNQPVDPVTSEDVHKGIPNLWWLKYDVPMIYADSPDRDHDGDGFSNREEFEAGTDPSNKNIHPPLVAKLMYVKDESEGWYIDFGLENEGKWFPRLKDLKGDTINRMGFQDGLDPGGLFFAEPPYAKRFKYVEIEEREIKNERLNIMEKHKYAIFEDQKENKQGERYEIPDRVPRAEIPNFVHYDRTAVLDLQALDQGGKEFKVEERTKFALPPGAPEKEYFLKEVTPDAIVVEWTDGDETKSLTIPVGGLGK